ncbi:hypothetical protein AGIG_G25478 [Arapaima gigas]
MEDHILLPTGKQGCPFFLYHCLFFQSAGTFLCCSLFYRLDANVPHSAVRMPVFRPWWRHQASAPGPAHMPGCAVPPLDHTDARGSDYMVAEGDVVLPMSSVWDQLCRCRPLCGTVGLVQRGNLGMSPPCWRRGQQTASSLVA